MIRSLLGVAKLVTRFIVIFLLELVSVFWGDWSSGWIILIVASCLISLARFYLGSRKAFLCFLSSIMLDSHFFYQILVYGY